MRYEDLLREVKGKKEIFVHVRTLSVVGDVSGLSFYCKVSKKDFISCICGKIIEYGNIESGFRVDPDGYIKYEV